MEEKNIFQKIMDREVPSHTIYEDEQFFVFLDIRPKGPGDTLIIPKKYYRWVWDVENIEAYFKLAQKIAFAQRMAFGTEMIRCEVYGDEVPHAHIKVWPMGSTVDPQDLEGNAKLLKDVLS